jgi:hypothetical protein
MLNDSSGRVIQEVPFPMGFENHYLTQNPTFESVNIGFRPHILTMS